MVTAVSPEASQRELGAWHEGHVRELAARVDDAARPGLCDAAREAAWRQIDAAREAARRELAARHDALVDEVAAVMDDDDDDTFRRGGRDGVAHHVSLSPPQLSVTAAFACGTTRARRKKGG